MVDVKNARAWSSVLEDATQNYPIYNAALEKEAALFHNLAERGRLGENVTVLCCGDGREVEMLLDLHQKFPQLKQLNGVDLLKLSIDQVRDKIRNRIDGLLDVEINLLCQDASKTSIAPNSQDTVTCMLTMVNFDDQLIDRLFHHVREILKPGGKFIFSVYNHQAFETRMELYTRSKLPIVGADRKTGLVRFEEGFEEASFSREFDKAQLERLIGGTDLEFSHFDSVGITHLIVLEKPKENVLWMKHPNFFRFSVAASIAAMLGGGAYGLSQQYAKEKQECAGDYRVSEIAPGITRGVCFGKEK